MIDAHIHAVHDHVPGSKPGGPEEVDLEGRPDAVADRLRAEMKEAGVTHALGMGRLDAPADDPLGVNGTLRLAALVPGLRAIGIADPTRLKVAHPEHFKKAEADIAAGKVVALKAYTGYLPYGPDSPAYKPYIRLAARYKIPFIFHTGDTWSTRAKLRYAHPLLVDDVAVDHPDVNFVIAHLGNPWLTDAAEVVYKNENVWADLSGILVGTPDSFKTGPDGKPAPDSHWALSLPDLHKAYRYADKPDRFLFGTDWPLSPMAQYRTFVESFIPKEHHAAVFDTNARKLFGLK
jgi:predicted TIM-barrel fold metal-dependent hydrolase